VVVYGGEKEVNITVSEKPIREHGSLQLSMENAKFDYENYTEEEMDKFIANYQMHSICYGGG